MTVSVVSAAKNTLLQNARDDSMVTPQKPGSCIENALHKDVFGVISGTGNQSFHYFSESWMTTAVIN